MEEGAWRWQIGFPKRIAHISKNILTYFVEVLEQVDYAALNLGLVQASGGRVAADTLGDKAGSELRSAQSDGGAADVEGSRGLDSGTGDGGPQGADNGGTEHVEGWMNQKSAKATNLITRKKEREWGD